MSKRPLLLLVLAGLIAAVPLSAAEPAFGVRSLLHELEVKRTVVSAVEISYEVRIVDLENGGVVMAARASGRPLQPVDLASANEQEKYRVRLAYTPQFFSATVIVSRATETVDNFRTWWLLDPASAGAAASQPEGINAPGAYRVGGEVKAPRVVNRVEPIFTPEARRDKVSGITIIEVLIGKDGRVKDAKVLKPLPDGLSESALAAVEQWEFEPGTLKGEPVDVIFNLTVNFKLDTKPPLAPAVPAGPPPDRN